MTKSFDDLKAGLEDVDRFLSGENSGFEVTSAAGAEVKDDPQTAKDDPESSRSLSISA